MSFLDNERPYVIAEIGVNHFDIAKQRGVSPMEAAKEMIHQAAESGADAVKFQSYSAETIAAKDSPAYWDTSEETATTQYELFSQYDEFGVEEFRELAEWTADELDIDFLSTPFDARAVEYLEPLVPAYKIASADITNHPLIRDIAQRGKPILLSTGASTVGEIDDAVRIIESEQSAPSLCLLHCILEYPTDPENANLGMIQHLSDLFPEYTVGYSDHVPPDEGMVTLLNAVAQGATVLEKHFTLDKSLAGNDHYHAANPSDLETFRKHQQRIRTTTGARRKEPIEAEQDSRKNARRSLVATAPIKVGEKLTRDNVGIKRPNKGLSPDQLDSVLGREAREQIAKGEFIRWNLL